MDHQCFRRRNGARSTWPLSSLSSALWRTIWSPSESGTTYRRLLPLHYLLKEYSQLPAKTTRWDGNLDMCNFHAENRILSSQITRFESNHSGSLECLQHVNDVRWNAQGDANCLVTECPTGDQKLQTTLDWIVPNLQMDPEVDNTFFALVTSITKVLLKDDRDLNLTKRERNNHLKMQWQNGEIVQMK